MGGCKVEESVISEPCDRLSELPDSLILDILSFLPMRDVVSTTFLSKRWNNLWTTVPCLDFCDICEIRDENEEERVRNFVNSALKLWKGTKVEKFKFNYSPHFDMSLASDIDSWVEFAVEHKVEVLEIRLWYDREELEWRNPVMTGKKGVYRAPLCLNSCSSIRELWLVGCNLQIGGPPAWNQLSSLRINGCFSERTIDRILLGSPCLEVFELCLLERYENLNIRSGSLKKLMIEKKLHFLDDSPSLDAVLRIHCPNLETLEISGVIYPKYIFTNVSSLTDVTLLGYEEPFYLKSPEIELLGESLRNILPAIQHVEKVTLSAWCVQV